MYKTPFFPHLIKIGALADVLIALDNCSIFKGFFSAKTPNYIIKYQSIMFGVSLFGILELGNPLLLLDCSKVQLVFLNCFV